MSVRKNVGTKDGRRHVVTVTIMDDSGDNNAAQIEFPAWFPLGEAGAACCDLEKLIAMKTDRVPVAFFGLICRQEDNTTVLRTTRAWSFEAVRTGSKAENACHSRYTSGDTIKRSTNCCQALDLPTTK